MGLIVVAADKGAPGVTTTALALAAVWPRPVLLAECDPAGGDIAFRFPAADGERLDPRRGTLSLAVAARRGLQPGQVWEHTQKLYGGMDVLLGVTNADQGASLSMFWGQLGQVLANVPRVDVIADCGRLGADGPVTDLLAEASRVLLLTRAEVGEVIRLRDRAVALAGAVEKRGRRGFSADVVVIAGQKNFKGELTEVAHALGQGRGSRAPARVLGGIVSDARAAGLLRGHWGGKLDKSMLIRSVREIAGQLAASMPAQPEAAAVAADPRPAYERTASQQAPGQYAGGHAAGQHAPGQYAPGQLTPGQHAASQYVAGQHVPDGQFGAGPHVSGQQGGGQPSTGQDANGAPAPGPHAPSRRAVRHRYEPDGRSGAGAPVAGPPQDGAAAQGQTPQVPQYRGR